MTTDKPHIIKNKGAQLKAISWVAAAFFLVGIAVISGLYFEKNTEIRSVEFEGNHYTSTDDLIKSIELPIGLMADSVNYSVLFNSIKTLPYVKDVSVSMSIRGRLSFSVSEHEPLALLVDGSNRIFVTESGLKLPVVYGRGNDVPLVYGFSAFPISDTLSSNEYKSVEQFLLEAKENRFSWITISEVAWNDREGVVALSHENGVKLIFGHEDFKERLMYWENFYSEVVSKKGIQSFQSVDLRFRNQIVTHES